MVFVGSLWLISPLCMAPPCKETCDFSWYNIPSNQGPPPKKVLSSPSLNFYDKLCHFFTQNMGKFWYFRCVFFSLFLNITFGYYFSLGGARLATCWNKFGVEKAIRLFLK
jgi:hypothetical protein